MPILKGDRFIFKSEIWLSQSSTYVCVTDCSSAMRGGRKWNEELTDRAWYCTSTTGQSPAKPCADSQDVALIHRLQPRFWGPGKGEQWEQGEGCLTDDREWGRVTGALGGTHRFNDSRAAWVREKHTNYAWTHYVHTSSLHAQMHMHMNASTVT